MGMRVSLILLVTIEAILCRTVESIDPVNWNIGDTVNFYYYEFDDGNSKGWEAVQLLNPYIICSFIGTNAQGFPFKGRIAIKAEGTFKDYKGNPPIEYGDPVPDGKYRYIGTKTFTLQNGFKEVLAILVSLK